MKDVTKLSKQQLIDLVLVYNDEAPREVLRGMTMPELRAYVEELRNTHGNLEDH